MDIVEVASYPKSGNTWLCYIISQYCLQQHGMELVVNGIHGKKDAIDKGESTISINNSIINFSRMFPFYDAWNSGHEGG